MEALSVRLIEILEEENRVYSDILDISRRKTRIIVDGKVDQLDRLTRTEQQMVIGIGRLEKEREGIIRQLAGHMGVERKDINIDMLRDRLRGGLKDRLSKAKDEIGKTLDELKKVNELNSQLIQKSLEYIDFSINLIAGDASRSTYSGGKGKDRKEGISFFDHKV